MIHYPRLRNPRFWYGAVPYYILLSPLILFVFLVGFIVDDLMLTANRWSKWIDKFDLFTCELFRADELGKWVERGDKE